LEVTTAHFMRYVRTLKEVSLGQKAEAAIRNGTHKKWKRQLAQTSPNPPPPPEILLFIRNVILPISLMKETTNSVPYENLTKQKAPQLRKDMPV
jgi:hypothetical protein